jgi:asparagine synthase (glutamine-hydrolysing)
LTTWYDVQEYPSSGEDEELKIMCGFVGFLGQRGADAGELEAIARTMANSIAHRGPDMDGIWTDPLNGLGLGHRRLSIVDLSVAGQQPMSSPASRYVIVFNGEIYNHRCLRKELEHTGLLISAWRGHSDTETLLAAFDTWGIEQTIDRCVGMFAFAVWDKTNSSLTLVRDRIGEKPLYYGWNNDLLLFASEIKAIKAHPLFRPEIDRYALSLFMSNGYVPSPHSIYKGIRKLQPGTTLVIEAGATECKGKPRAYWSLEHAISGGLSAPFAGSRDEAVTELERLLRRSISQQMAADVPLGAFLSGGIDSSAVVALMQAQSKRRIKTFTIGSCQAECDEAAHAREVAKYLGTEHTEVYVTPEQALTVIPQLPLIYGEPFADSSQIPTFLVAQMARRYVTVSLSGDAGDELFGGYNRYFLTKQAWGTLSGIPLPFRRAVAASLNRISPSGWAGMLDPLQCLLPGRFRLADIGEKVRKCAIAFPSKDYVELYERLVSHWPENIVIGGACRSDKEHRTIFPVNDIVQQMMAWDMLGYLPDDILCKVDRAAMAVSLETRIPFLDHRIIEFAWQLPLSYNIHDGQGKRLLRQVLYRYVPQNLIDRPKTGFSVPLASWLRGPLRSWSEDLLDHSRLQREGFFDPIQIRQAFTEHLSGKRNWQDKLWAALMFQTWLEHQK